LYGTDGQTDKTRYMAYCVSHITLFCNDQTGCWLDLLLRMLTDDFPIGRSCFSTMLSASLTDAFSSIASQLPYGTDVSSELYCYNTQFCGWLPHDSLFG